MSAAFCIDRLGTLPSRKRAGIKWYRIIVGFPVGSSIILPTSFYFLIHPSSLFYLFLSVKSYEVGLKSILVVRSTEYIGVYKYFGNVKPLPSATFVWLEEISRASGWSVLVVCTRYSSFAVFFPSFPALDGARSTFRTRPNSGETLPCTEYSTHMHPTLSFDLELEPPIACLQ